MSYWQQPGHPLYDTCYPKLGISAYCSIICHITLGLVLEIKKNGLLKQQVQVLFRKTALVGWTEVLREVLIILNTHMGCLPLMSTCLQFQALFPCTLYMLMLYCHSSYQPEGIVILHIEAINSGKANKSIGAQLSCSPPIGQLFLVTKK